MSKPRHKDLYDNTESKIRYEAYSRLQAAAVAFGESLPIPEIVTVGGQSDGKSSLLEAFLGFRFNIREVEMGTRRPLIVQMVHDPTATEPRCRFQNEETDEYGSPVAEDKVADEIKNRTESLLRKLGNATVSAKPIVMRAEYAYCPNLTLIDTPGFILKSKAKQSDPDGFSKTGEQDDSTPDDILQMVKAQISAPHRLILFLQQSSVEWASSLWLHVVQEVDPSFQRTVVVSSKFDNRLKEFQERWEVDRYLAAAGYLPGNVRPFFVALPKDRNIANNTVWREQIQAVDMQVLTTLREGVSGGFDEERFGTRVGFANLKRFLEEELARRYRDAAPATLALLQDRCESVASELVAAEAKLRSAEDVSALRRSAMHFAGSIAAQVSDLLDGSATDPDPASHGFTTEEERLQATSASQWPGIPDAASVRPSNASLKLYGGAAFERCLHEFQEAARSLEFPVHNLQKDRVANLILATRGKTGSGAQTAARAAEDIARKTARDLLRPLLDTACARLASVLRHAYEMAAEKAQSSSPTREAMRPYVAFHAALRSAYMQFFNKLEEETRRHVHHHLDVATSEFFAQSIASRLATGQDPSEGETWGAATPGHDFEAMPDLLRAEQGPGFDLPADENGAVASPLAHAAPAASGPDAPGGIAMDTDGTAAAAERRMPLTESQMTVPETPSPELGAAKPGQHVDGSPSKGRLAKTQRRTMGPTPPPDRVAGNPLFSEDSGQGTYHDVCRNAEQLFRGIRHAVAAQAAPATLKASFLDPVRKDLEREVSFDLFARTDGDFMTMFSAEGAIAALEAKRNALQRRVEGLLKCKNEFQELARCL